MHVLVTGFEPFGGDRVNASGVVVGRLAASWSHPGVELSTAVLPVEFRAAPRVLAAAIRATRPDAVICLGEAGGRSDVTPERWAGSTADARIPDNAGAAPRDEPLDAVAARLGSRLDVDAMVSAILRAGVPARASEDAGRYVCNATYRALLRDHDIPAAFIHVPALRHTGAAGVGAETDEGRGGEPAAGLGFDDLVRAVAAVVSWLGTG